MNVSVGSTVDQGCAAVANDRGNAGEGAKGELDGEMGVSTFERGKRAVGEGVAVGVAVEPTAAINAWSCSARTPVASSVSITSTAANKPLKTAPSSPPGRTRVSGLFPVPSQSELISPAHLRSPECLRSPGRCVPRSGRLVDGNRFLMPIGRQNQTEGGAYPSLALHPEVAIVGLY